MIDTKALIQAQKEKSDKLCNLLGIEIRHIATPNGLNLPTLPNMYNPFNFVQLWEVIMHNLMIDNGDFFQDFQDGKQTSAVDWLIDGLISYMSEEKDEYKSSQEAIKSEVKNLGWFTIK